MWGILLAGVVTFVATMDGGRVVPPVPTLATGTATFELLGDSAVRYRVEVAAIRSVWSVSIYAAGPDSTGLRMVTLFVGPTSGETNGVLAEGTFAERDMLGTWTLKDLVGRMQSSQAYVAVLTAAHSEGEIRGQVQPGESPPSTPRQTGQAGSD